MLLGTNWSRTFVLGLCIIGIGGAGLVCLVPSDEGVYAIAAAQGGTGSGMSGRAQIPQEKSSPSEFADEVAYAHELLLEIEEGLLEGEDVKPACEEIDQLYTRLRRLGRDILKDFEAVEETCIESQLPDEILHRYDIAVDRFEETEQVVTGTLKEFIVTYHMIRAKERLAARRDNQGPTKQQQDKSDYLGIRLEAVGKAIAVFEDLRLIANPHMQDRRPPLWEVQEPQEAPLRPHDANTVSINVMAAAGATSPVEEDLIETMDVQITDEILDKAEELGYSPSAIYEFVRNECRFQPYYGSRKGSVETLRQRCGNDYDLASLTIALLRASGVEARYASGIVQIPTDRITSWLSVDDGRVAGSILTTVGMEGMAMMSGSEVMAVRCRRVWVEAYVSRGRGGKVWVPLDPAFKLHDIRSGVDVPAAMGFDAQAFIDEYIDPTDPAVELPRAETPLELLKNEIYDYLLAQDPCLTGSIPEEVIESVKRAQEILPENLGLLPASLPYKVLSRDAYYSEIPADKVYQIRFHLHDGGTTLINETLDLPEIASKRITVSYVGATPADEATIDSYGGILNTPPYLINLKAVLKIGGQEVARSSAVIGAGITHTFDIHFIASANAYGYPHNMVPSISNNIIAGEYRTVGLAVHGATNPLLEAADPADTEGFMAQLRRAAAMGYLGGCIASDDEFGALLHAKVVRDVDDAVIEEQIFVTYDMWGNPLSWEWKGLTVDADRKIIGVWKVDEYEPDCGGEGKEIMILGGAEGSLYENLIFEDSFDKEAVSTIKILELAAEQGIPVYKRWNSTTLPGDVTLPTQVRNAIVSSIAAGSVVTFPARQITHGNWTGCGYIDMDDCTGAAGYIISGGQNGGSTVVVWYDWLFIWSSKELKYIEGEILFPDHDSVYAKMWFMLNPPMFFTYRLRAVFEDDSHDYWRYFTSPTYANIQFQFLPPDHYVVRVGEDAGADERKVTIFDVKIKKSDESDPPEYLPVKPASGTAPQESYKAVIDPDDVTGDFEWTGSSKLTVKSPDTQVTDVEPAGPDPSSSVKAESLNVTFTPDTPGPYGSHVSDTAEHKMSVVEILITDVKFNHSTSDSTDAIDIRENYSTDITVPEWVKGGQNKPAAYKKGINVTLKGRFTISPAVNVRAEVSADSSSAGLGNLAKQAIQFSGGVSSPEYISFTPGNPTPAKVGKDTLEWQWKVDGLDGSTLPAFNINTSGPHTLYTVLDTPKAPMSEPWTEVLDKSCVWANGQTSPTAAASKVVENIYSSGYKYDVVSGAPQYSLGGDFDLTDCLSEWGSSVQNINCWDCANMSAIFSNALGCTLDRYYITRPGSSSFLLNYIKAIGRSWTNDPFTVPGRQGFSLHWTAWSAVYDSCLQVDDDSDPGTSPHTGKLPVNMSFSDYRKKLVDPLHESQVSGVKESPCAVK